MPFLRRSLEERFWEKVDKSGPIHPYKFELGHCWIWIRGCDSSGYGQIREDSPSKKQLKAHRVSYEIHKGLIPVGLKIRHTCDSPSCVNPAHLLCGTEQENSDDMVGRGRQSKGEKQHLAKLTEEKVAEIRREYVRGSRTHGQHALAQKYGVADNTIGFIVREETWRP